MKRTTKQIKKQQLWYRLSLTPQILELATEEEKAHGEAELRKRRDARLKLWKLRTPKGQPNPNMYNGEFWTTHAQYENADSAIRGLRAILRLRYSKTLEEGLYRNIKQNTYAKTKMGMFGKGRGHYIKKDGLLMWIERDEFGDNWFLDLDENKMIVCIKGAALQNIIPVPPELLTEEEQK